MSNEMERQLHRIRRAYDLTVRDYELGINPLEGVPDYLKNAPEFQSFVAETSESCHVGAPDVEAFLAPKKGMAFLDVGCAAGLQTHQLYNWPSLYHGVDVSPGLINAMRRFAANNSYEVGALHVADAATLPFHDSHFDIAAMIGVLEYCAFDYVRAAINELSRVLKPGGKLVLDVPNLTHPYVDFMFSLEESLGRPQYAHNKSDFEEVLTGRFEIASIDTSLVMIKYFCRSRSTAN